MFNRLAMFSLTLFSLGFFLLFDPLTLSLIGLHRGVGNLTRVQDVRTYLVHLCADVVNLSLQGAQQVLGREVDEKAHTEQLNRVAAQL